MKTAREEMVPQQMSPGETDWDWNEGASDRLVPGLSPLIRMGRRLGREALRRVDTVLNFFLAPLLRRRVRVVTAAAIAVVAVWNSDSPRSMAQSLLAMAGRPLHQRAAFTWQESFDKGLSTWIYPSALSPADSGAVRVGGLALHGKTMALKNYGMEFSARIDKKSIGWVVCAADPGNYAVFKLTERGRSPAGLKFDLVRYLVIDGRAPAPSERKAVPLIIHPRENNFLDIAVRVAEGQILTTINGFGADTWKPRELKTGGMGFLAEKGESFLVSSLTISGNEDFLGLFIWGAEETFRSVRRNLWSLTASIHNVWLVARN